MSNKYPGYNDGDTFWDDYIRKHGQMTNREFFSSNGPGGFYEGMEWDGEEWVPNAASRQRQWEREEKNKCQECGEQKPYCDCY